MGRVSRLGRRLLPLATGGAADATSIHTHMCYAEFNDIMSSIAAMDADVISIETTRSRMELLDAFTPAQDGGTAYPAEIGPGIWDIHSPRVPAASEMAELLDLARQRLQDWQIWVNPDCGLKTRRWEEVRPALKNLVVAARRMRARHVDCCGGRASPRGPRACATSSAGTCAVSAGLSGAPDRGRSAASLSRRLRPTYRSPVQIYGQPMRCHELCRTQPRLACRRCDRSACPCGLRSLRGVPRLGAFRFTAIVGPSSPM